MQRERTPEQIEAKRQQRAAWQKRQQEKRARDKQAEEIYERAQNREQFWAHNRAALKPEELQALETKQTEFLALRQSVQDVIEHLNKPGAKIGPPDGLPFVDTLFEEVEAYVISTGNCRIMHHADAEEFASVHRPDINPKIREEFYRWDKNWYTYGFSTVFSHATLRQFLHAVAEFITKHPNHEDFDQAIAAQILIEQRAHVPVPVQVVPQPAPISEVERVERAIRESLNAGFATPPLDWKL